MHRQDTLDVATTSETRIRQDRRDLVGFGNRRRDHQHDRDDGLRAGLGAPPCDGFGLELEETDPVKQLGLEVRTIILAPDKHRGLDELVGDRRNERIPVDDLTRWRSACAAWQ